MPDADYWKSVLSNPDRVVVLDEGAKKAGAWLSAGICCLALPGIFAGTPPVDRQDPEPSMGLGYGDRQTCIRPTDVLRRKKRRLHPDLEPFARGRRFIISFDYESTDNGQRRRDAATRELVEQLYAAGASSVAVSHRQGPEKGADDLLVARGRDALYDLLNQAQEQGLGKIAPQYSRPKTQELSLYDHPAEVLANHLIQRVHRGIAARASNTGLVATITQLANTPGTGKSHLAPELGPRLLEADVIDRVVYVSSSYRSPSISALERWIETPTRHSGLVAEDVANQQRIRRRRKSDPQNRIVVKPTCSYSNNLQYLRDRGLGQKAITGFCQQECPERSGCHYVQERLSFLEGLRGNEHRLIRCSAEMLSVLQHWLGPKAWERTFLIFDEAPQLQAAAIDTKAISLADLPVWASYLRMHQPELCESHDGQQLITLLDIAAALPERLNKQEALYGCDPVTLASILPLITTGVVEALKIPVTSTEGITPDSTPLLHSAPTPALLGELLQALLPPNERVHRRVLYTPRDGGQLQIISLNPSVAQAHRGSAGSLVLDGTADLEAITNHLTGGETPPSSPELRPEAIETPTSYKLAQIEVVQISDLGVMGRNRGDDCKQRLGELLEGLRKYVCDRFGPNAHLGVIDNATHRSRDDGHGAWFVDNQGSNAFQHDQAIALVGLPAPNLNASLAQFQVLYNQPRTSITSASFRSWYGRQMGEQLIQAIHRLRPIRREGEVLLVFLICSADLSGIGFQPGVKGGRGSLTVMESSYFNPAAAPKAERTRRKVIGAIQQLYQEGVSPKQITTRLVAQRAGVDAKTCRNAGQGFGWSVFVSQCLQSAPDKAGP